MNTTEKKHSFRAQLSSFAGNNKNALVRYGLLILVFVVFTIATGGRMLALYSIRSIISQLTPLMIMCVGMLLLLVFTYAKLGGVAGAHQQLTDLFSKNVPAPKIAPRVTKKRPAGPACSKPMSPSRIAKPATAAPLAKMIVLKDTTPPWESAMKSPPIRLNAATSAIKSSPTNVLTAL